jgi:hypothetical protein
MENSNPLLDFEKFEIVLLAHVVVTFYKNYSLDCREGDMKKNK